jgi:putative protease
VALAESQPAGAAIWRIEPNEPVATLRDLRADVAMNRNRDHEWNRLLEGKTAERRIGLDWQLGESAQGLRLRATDAEGNWVSLPPLQDLAPAQNAQRAEAALRECLGKLGNTRFEARHISIGWQVPRYLPAAAANAWRREAIDQLEQVRLQRLGRLPRRAPVQPPVPYPADGLSYLGNVANQRAAAFYARHGVAVVEAAYEGHQELGDVSLMITKHCIRYSLSLCPKQAKGVTGVQGTIRAEPMTLVNGKERLSLQFDCKACEMHVVGRIKKSILAHVPAVPVRFHARSTASASSTRSTATTSNPSIG